MNQYHIQHRFKTLAEVYDTFEFRGYTLGPWNYDPIGGHCGDAWLCQKIVEANNANDAFQAFMEGLRPVVDRVAFVSQCYTSIDLEPFRLIKLNDNNDRVCFFSYSEEEPPVHLMFLDDEIEALRELEKYPERGDAFRYLREAGLASSTFPRFAMLASALEALAGEVTDKRGNKKANKDYIRDNILKDAELTDSLYGYGTGVRNVLLHGQKVEPLSLHTDDGHVVDRIYSSIIQYFQDTHGVEIDRGVVHPLRHPLMNYRGWRCWAQPLSEDVDTNLLDMHEAFRREDEDGSYDDLGFQARFKILDQAPAGY